MTERKLAPMRPEPESESEDDMDVSFPTRIDKGMSSEDEFSDFIGATEAKKVMVAVERRRRRIDEEQRHPSRYFGSSFVTVPSGPNSFRMVAPPLTKGMDYQAYYELLKRYVQMAQKGFLGAPSLSDATAALRDFELECRMLGRM